MATDKIIEQLNSFLRGEISAVQTYRQALGKVKDIGIRARLEDCVRSHEERVELLQRHVRELGGEPAVDSGPWGAFAKMVQGGADVLGDKAAVAVLEQGEDHGLSDYQRGLTELDSDSVRLVTEELLPAQQRTHATVSSIKHELH